MGLTEAEARANHDDVRVTRSSLRHNARALIAGGEGHVKLVTTGDGRLLGAHVVGPEAGDLVSAPTLARAWGAHVADVAVISHAHPTLAEAVGEAFLAAAGTPFHA